MRVVYQTLVKLRGLVTRLVYSKAVLKVHRMLLPVTCPIDLEHRTISRGTACAMTSGLWTFVVHSSSETVSAPRVEIVTCKNGGDTNGKKVICRFGNANG